MNSSKFSFTGKDLSIYGGYSLIGNFFKKQKLEELIKNNWDNRKKSNNKKSEYAIISSFIAGTLASKQDITGISNFSRDWASEEFAGITSHSKSTMSRFLNSLNYKQTIRIEAMIQEISQRTLKSANIKNVTIDLDSSVKTVYGNQEGAERGYNPQKKGRKSYNIQLGFVANTESYLHGTIRPGNCVSLTGAKEFINESLAKLPSFTKKVTMRMDSGFFSANLFLNLIKSDLNFFCACRLTNRIKELIWSQYGEKWRSIDSKREITEIPYQIASDNSRTNLRMVVVRQRIEDDKNPPQGKLLIDVPGYTFSAIVTNVSWQSPVSIWQFYNKRSDMENRIKEIKEDFLPRLSCRSFWANQGLFLLSMLAYELFNLLRKTCFRDNKSRHCRFYTFFRKYILLAVRRIKPQGKIRYILPSTYCYKADFLRLMSLVI